MADLNPTTGEPRIDEHAPAADDLMREHRLQRNLKLLVTFLGLLILAGLAAVVVRVVYLANNPRTAPDSAASPTGAPAALDLPAGSRIVSVTATDQRIVVHHDGPRGAGITVLDLTTGQRLLDITPREAPPAN